ncbi:MAG TPA: hypothetical protein VFG88_10575 [Nocardioidaceae bacterium]|nr:hypothetical protein [Nocardioidaceae bacterium]
MSEPLTVPLGRDLPCPVCGHGPHRWSTCECACPAHDLTDDIEP